MSPSPLTPPAPFEDGLADAIDASFSAGPPPAPVDDHVRAGRRALRRRRVVRGIAGAALVAVAGPPAAYALVQSQQSGSNVVTPDDGIDDQISRPYGLNEGEMVGAAAGQLVIGKGVTVNVRVDNPMGSPAPADSWGLDVSRGDRHEWALVEWAPMGGAVISEPPRRRFPTFRLWLRDTVAAQKGLPRLSLVRFAPSGSLAPRAGVTIVRQQTIGPLDGAVRGTRNAVAEVRWHGARWYVLASQEPGGDPVYTPAAASVTAPTLAGFLAQVRQPRGLYAVEGAQR